MRAVRGALHQGSRPGEAAVVPARSRHRVAGYALLDVLAALAVLGGAGLALTASIHEALRAQLAAGREERAFEAADRVLAAMTLLTSKDLDQRLGARRAGEFVVDVQRPEAGLYRIAIADARSPERLMLVTVVGRKRDP